MLRADGSFLSTKRSRWPRSHTAPVRREPAALIHGNLSREQGEQSLHENITQHQARREADIADWMVSCSLYERVFA
jgi:hypothetical protein